MRRVFFLEGTPLPLTPEQKPLQATNKPCSRFLNGADL